ncbi:hypothetical protein DL770_007370 [Monosporascus sp. CRB-9-2]|nr:hypothetical protein DL770_007370 [Monosporascus sp. CRB-9-2]
MPNIVVIGAGVSGLTSAYLLSKEKDNAITVVAKHMPGDYDIEYASPWAGANNGNLAEQPLGTPDMARDEAPRNGSAGGRYPYTDRVYRREKDLEKLRRGGYSYDGLFTENPWYGPLFDDFRELPKDELPEGIASGCEFSSVCINTALYLPWLLGKCRANGVVFRRGQLKHVSEAAAMSRTGASADIVINTTGLMASRLGGVMDQSLYPIRGQIVVVRNEAPHMLTTSGTDDSDEEIFYIMMRAAGGGTILGGTYQQGQWESQPDPNIAMRIMRRAVEMVPELSDGKGVQGLDIVRHGVGLRPGRKGGVRIEKEKIGDTWVVHNYGHAGWGYQGSYGCAEGVVELVREILNRPKL